MDMPEPPTKAPDDASASPDPYPVRHPPPSPGSLAEDLSKLFDVTGGSILYCVSAVLVAYGIVNVLGPVLTKDSFWEAFPCILTLHVYELALLGVLILIVAKKVVDDAISVTFLIALYLIGTSIAFGSVADRAIPVSLWVGAVSIALAFGKLYALRHLAKLPLCSISLLGLMGLVACNYLGPVILAHSISVDASAEQARRSLWFILQLGILLSSGCVLVAMVRHQVVSKARQGPSVPFLHTPSMVILFALVLLSCSGVHLYAMAFASALERTIADFIPLMILVCLFVLELLRHLHKRHAYADIAVACLPILGSCLAINERSVASASYLGWGALGYPPVQFALGGSALAALACFRKQSTLWYAVAAYGLGFILTLGYSPAHPYALNYLACIVIAMIGFLAYGLLMGKPLACVAAVVLLCLELDAWGPWLTLRESYQVTQLGSLSGVFGLSCLVLYLAYGKRLHQMVGWLAALSFAVFVYDFLPNHAHLRYVAMGFVVILLMLALWIRLRDIRAIAILGTPLALRFYIIMRFLGHWRFVILGFLALGVGALASLFKRRAQQRQGQTDPDPD